MLSRLLLVMAFGRGALCDDITKQSMIESKTPSQLREILGMAHIDVPIDADRGMLRMLALKHATEEMLAPKQTGAPAGGMPSGMMSMPGGMMGGGMPPGMMAGGMLPGMMGGGMPPGGAGDPSHMVEMMFNMLDRDKDNHLSEEEMLNVGQTLGPSAVTQGFISCCSAFAAAEPPPPPPPGQRRHRCDRYKHQRCG